MDPISRKEFLKLGGAGMGGFVLFKGLGSRNNSGVAFELFL